MEYQMCRACGETKPLTAFPFHNRRKNERSTRCCSCMAAYLAKYHRTRTPPSMRPDVVSARAAEWRETHRIAKRAHKAVEEALAAGRLIRGPCADCGAATADAHHSDYSAPLAVVWLCRSCHQRVHAEEREGLRRYDARERPIAEHPPRDLPWREEIRRRIEDRRKREEALP